MGTNGVSKRSRINIVRAGGAVAMVQCPSCRSRGAAARFRGLVEVTFEHAISRGKITEMSCTRCGATLTDLRYEAGRGVTYAGIVSPDAPR